MMANEARVAVLERAICRIRARWGDVGVDGRNDRPWAELRGGKALQDAIEETYTLVDCPPEDEES